MKFFYLKRPPENLVDDGQLPDDFNISSPVGCREKMNFTRLEEICFSALAKYQEKQGLAKYLYFLQKLDNIL